MRLLPLLPALLAAPASAHGFIKSYLIHNLTYPGFDPYLDTLNQTHPPARIAYAIADNAPVYDVTHRNITCSPNPHPSPPALTAPVPAGTTITLHYTPWPSNHFGSILFYLARCPRDCADFYAPDHGARWFKVAQWARDPDGTWVTDRFRRQNSTWDIPVPRDLAPGGYVARVEMVSLHAVGVPGYGAELYPHCFNLRIEGGGSRRPVGVRLPGAYAMDEPGLVYNETAGDTDYVFPGPPLYTEVADEEE